MEMVNIHDAKTHLSRLLERVQKGEEIIIAKAGKPVARLVAIEVADKPKTNRFGFMKGELDLPEDFDIKAYRREEIEDLFYGEE